MEGIRWPHALLHAPFTARFAFTVWFYGLLARFAAAHGYTHAVAAHSTTRISTLRYAFPPPHRAHTRCVCLPLVHRKHQFWNHAPFTMRTLPTPTLVCGWDLPACLDYHHVLRTILYRSAAFCVLHTLRFGLLCISGLFFLVCGQATLRYVSRSGGRRARASRREGSGSCSALPHAWTALTYHTQPHFASVAVGRTFTAFTPSAASPPAGGRQFYSHTCLPPGLHRLTFLPPYACRLCLSSCQPTPLLPPAPPAPPKNATLSPCVQSCMATSHLPAQCHCSFLCTCHCAGPDIHTCLYYHCTFCLPLLHFHFYTFAQILLHFTHTRFTCLYMKKMGVTHHMTKLLPHCLVLGWVHLSAHGYFLHTRLYMAAHSVLCMHTRCHCHLTALDRTLCTLHTG